MAEPDGKALTALRRFGLGGRSDSLKRIAGDPLGACLAEISPTRALIGDPSLPKTARAIQIISEIEQKRRLAREAQRVAQAATPQASLGAGSQAQAQAQPAQQVAAIPSATVYGPPAPPQPMIDPDEISINDVVFAELRARFEHGIAQEIGFAERWVMFWSNHFTIALRRGSISRIGAGAYEREAIRPHVFGRFADLLLAVESHPAMLHYLDQRQSIGPGSPAGRRRQRGLNENLAREILELHTLGVDGGYTQADVTSFAKALTGWSITGGEENLDGYGAFVFAPNRHEPGVQTVLGRRYADDGVEQGKAILRDLAAHSATARFIARKLARHFVTDEPPAEIVVALEQDFLASGGDLGSLARALLTTPAVWEAPARKLRTPAEFLLAAFRATDERPNRPPAVANWLNLMGQPLWNPIGPNGHPDDEASIAAPRALKLRMDIAAQIARPAAARHDPRQLAEELFGSSLSPETRQAIARAEQRPQGLAILLMSPEFQRR